MLAYLHSRGLTTDLVQRHPTLPTGTVGVTGPRDAPRYEIRTGVAWDEIALSDDILRAARESDAIVFGTLAARSETNRRTLDALLDVPGPLKMIDVNLRPPFDDHERALALARRVDWMKLNEGELQQLTGLSTGGGDLRRAMDRLREMAGLQRVCATRGEHGAVLWQQGEVVAGEPPKVNVVDTVGAGDAFTAALLHGLLALPAGSVRVVLDRALRLGATVASLPGAQPEYQLPW
jgi:fructokinase